ncbi:MAG: L,D-transpeptidase [Alphaproteobacteria bacterium]
MTGRVCQWRARGWGAACALLLALTSAAGMAAGTETAARDGGAPELSNSLPPELDAKDKARLSWRSKEQSGSRSEDGPPALEDVMSRDRIIEEFGVLDDPANTVPAPPSHQATAMPVPRTFPVDPGVLRFRPLHRIRQLVRDELYQHFDLYLYVNKAPKGVWAQQMFVYERQEDGGFRQLFRWRTSTGREKNERYFTTTPVGIFKLDPNRFRKMYHSVQWGGVAMPFAMFLDFSYSSRKSGIAIHGTRGSSERRLGRRASGGCIRLAVNNARMLFYLIQTSYEGMVPKFAFDRERGHTSKTGELVHDENGDPVMENGYRVLLIVDYVTN